jgi:putative DNA primase/helicase
MMDRRTQPGPEIEIITGDTHHQTMIVAVRRDIDFAAVMEPVAQRLLGEPNWRKGHKLYYGTRGSLVIDLKKGCFYDHENKIGGGTLDLIDRKTGRKGADAMQWLEDGRLLAPDISSKRAHTLSAAATGPNQKPKQARIVNEYDYVDENHEHLYQVVRLEPKDYNVVPTGTVVGYGI